MGGVGVLTTTVDNLWDVLMNIETSHCANRHKKPAAGLTCCGLSFADYPNAVRQPSEILSEENQVGLGKSLFLIKSYFVQMTRQLDWLQKLSLLVMVRVLKSSSME